MWLMEYSVIGTRHSVIIITTRTVSLSTLSDSLSSIAGRGVSFPLLLLLLLLLLPRAGAAR